jgi:hypothetical protein
MLQTFANIQAGVLALVFIWSGIGKLALPQARAVAAQSALAQLLGQPNLTQIAYVTLGSGEVVMGLLLLTPPHKPWALWLATAFTAGFVVYLLVAWRIAPEKPCACMGTRATPISWRSVTRAILLLALALVGWQAATYWGVALWHAPVSLIVALLEIAAIIALSPEIVGDWRTLRWRAYRQVQSTLQTDCARIAVDWDVVLQRLKTSDAYQTFAPYLTLETTERRREGCWHFLTYAGRYENQPATAIFAVPVLFDPKGVKGALVDTTDATLYLLAGPMESESDVSALIAVL